MPFRPPIEDPTNNGSDHELRHGSDLCGNCGKSVGDVAVLSPTMNEHQRILCRDCAADLFGDDFDELEEEDI